MKLTAACLSILLLAGCLAGPAEPVAPAKDTLADHTRCDYRDRDNRSLDCSKAAQEVPLVPTLDGNLWFCADSMEFDGHTYLGIFYDPQSKRNALWFNFTPDEHGPGKWFASVYVEGGAFYSFTSPKSTGYVILPTTLPDGQLHLDNNRVTATLGGALDGGELRLVWMREPLGPGWQGLDGTWTGVINAVRVDGNDYWFFNRQFGRGSAGHWEGQDYSLTVDWTNYGRGTPVQPTLPTLGVWTPAAEQHICS